MISLHQPELEIIYKFVRLIVCLNGLIRHIESTSFSAFGMNGCYAIPSDILTNMGLNDKPKY